MTKLFYKGKPVKIHIDFPHWVEAFCPICDCSGMAVKNNVIKPHSNWGEICPGAKLDSPKEMEQKVMSSEGFGCYCSGLQAGQAIGVAVYGIPKNITNRE